MALASLAKRHFTMKKILSLLALVAVVLSARATGTLPLNSPQSGVLSFTNGGATSITNSFLPGFSYAPAFSAFLTSANTNALPITTTITSSNYIVTINTSTNATVVWAAQMPVLVNQVGYMRLQQGSFAGATSGATTYTNTFSTPYLSTPIVNISTSLLGAATNSAPAITSVSTTAFIVSYGATTNQTVYWNALGPCATAGPSTVTY